jgi:rhodanese-related sulfurtransferase
MKKIMLIILIAISSLFGQLEQVVATPKFIKENSTLKIIDIRTPPEWRETGIVKGSYTIMFFDEQGGYNVEEFIRQLDKIVKNGEKFALICRTGSRTSAIAPFLSDKLGYNVINMRGGIEKLMRDGMVLDKI